MGRPSAPRLSESTLSPQISRISAETDEGPPLKRTASTSPRRNNQKRRIIATSTIRASTRGRSHQGLEEPIHVFKCDGKVHVTLPGRGLPSYSIQSQDNQMADVNNTHRHRHRWRQSMTAPYQRTWIACIMLGCRNGVASLKTSTHARGMGRKMWAERRARPR